MRTVGLHSAPCTVARFACAAARTAVVMIGDQNLRYSEVLRRANASTRKLFGILTAIMAVFFLRRFGGRA